MKIRTRADQGGQPSKIESQKAKKRDFQKDWEKAMKNPIKSQKIRRTCGQLKTADFYGKHIEKQPKTSQNSLFSAVFWSKWQDSNLRSHRPERCAIPPSLHLDVVKIFDFFVSGQTCGQTEELMIFRHSGEPKKSVFSRVFGSSRKLYAENGDWVPNVALYQTEPHLVISLPKCFEYYIMQWNICQVSA